MASSADTAATLPKPKLSVTEKLQLCSYAIQALCSAVFTILSAPFFRTDESPFNLRHVAYAALRSFTENGSVRMSRALEETTDEVYQQFAPYADFIPGSVVLADGTKGHWIGSVTARRVVIYFHGGGYGHYCMPAHFTYLWNYVVKPNDGNVSVLFLAYDLAPEHTYPRQLQQAAAMLGYVVNKIDKSPSEIILGGDSAGANLVLGLLSHLSHPHPSVPPVVLSTPLLGAFIVSPWVSFDLSQPSVRENVRKDCLSLKVMQAFGNNFLGLASRDNYNEPLLAPADWWRQLKAQGILVLAGGDEILIDGIREFTTKLQSSHPAATTFIAAHEAHTQPITDLIFGYKKVGKQAEYLAAWITKNVGN